MEFRFFGWLQLTKKGTKVLQKALEFIDDVIVKQLIVD